MFLQPLINYLTKSQVPKIQTDLGKEIHFVKLPNFLSVESRPFDGETYEDEMDDEATQQDEEGRTRLKLKVENTIRWRQGFDKEGHPVKESNARIVKWSDGSYSLHLGNEIFDVHKQPLQSDFNHLFIRQVRGCHLPPFRLTYSPHLARVLGCKVKQFSEPSSASDPTPRTHKPTRR